MFLGYTTNGYKNSTTPSPIYISQFNTISISDGIFDELLITKNTDDNVIDEGWDYNTILHAFFNNNLQAGNLSYSISEINEFKVKRRKVGEFDWLELYSIDVNDTDNGLFTIKDKYVGCDEYEYAIVPISNGREGNYTYNNINVNYDKLYIMNSEDSYSTQLDINVKEQKIKKSTAVETLGSKYPFKLKTSKINYFKGSVSATFIKDVDGEFDLDNIKEYRDSLVEFLCDGTPKIIKTPDGIVRLVEIDDEISNEQEDYSPKYTTSFSYVEIGDVNNYDDLSSNGLLNVKVESV